MRPGASIARGWLTVVVALAILCADGLGCASAVDLSVSGFGTLGYAQSNRPYGYQRFIDDGGTLMRDSVVGLQIDGKMTSELGATVQVKAAAATASDSRYEGSVSWAFLSYRPSNDWLFRAGKQRIPFYLYSETYDVGATYDYVRLPTEMYSLAPSNDFVGVSFTRTFRLREGEMSVDGYWGQSQNDFRFFFRDGIPGVQEAGPLYLKLKFRGGGLVGSYRAGDQVLRLGLHRATIRPDDNSPLPASFPFVPVTPGVGYFQVDPALPGPGVPTTRSVSDTLVTIGAEVSLPSDVIVAGEYARTIARNSELAPQGNRGYLALRKRWGDWTPYATYAFLKSPANQRHLYSRANGNQLPGFIPGAALINLSQRAGADQIITYDQWSWAVGASYTFSASSKLKAEFQQTRIGTVSQLVDAPSGGNVRNERINILSIAYSAVF